MASTTDIPVLIEPDAAERIAELGLQKELDKMLDHAKQTVPGLHRLRVEVDYRANMGEEDALTIWAYREYPGGEPENDRADRQFGLWAIDTFPPDVKRWVVLISIYEEPNGR
jgi:hypothetical protein